MKMALMRVNPLIRDWFKVVGAAPDLPAVDDVVGDWMRNHGVTYGDRIQAVHCYIDGMYDAALVWVVSTESGRVFAVSNPPVGRTLPLGPCPIHLETKVS